MRRMRHRGTKHFVQVGQLVGSGTEVPTSGFVPGHTRSACTVQDGTSMSPPSQSFVVLSAVFTELKLTFFFFSFLLSGCTCDIWKLLSQGSRHSHCRNSTTSLFCEPQRKSKMCFLKKTFCFVRIIFHSIIILCIFSNDASLSVLCLFPRNCCNKLPTNLMA